MTINKIAHSNIPSVTTRASKPLVLNGQSSVRDLAHWKRGVELGVHNLCYF